MDGWMKMLIEELQEIIYINMDLENKSVYTVCLSQKPENIIHPELSGCDCGFLYTGTQPTRPLWGNATAVKFLRLRFQTTCIQGTAPRSEVCPGSIFSLILTPVLAVVSTELEITPLASGALNAKLCLVNKAVCLDGFCRLGSLNFNASSVGNEGVIQWRAEGGS